MTRHPRSSLRSLNRNVQRAARVDGRQNRYSRRRRSQGDGCRISLHQGLAQWTGGPAQHVLRLLTTRWWRDRPPSREFTFSSCGAESTSSGQRRRWQPSRWTDPALASGSTVIKALHITNLRIALAQAYAAAGLTAPVYTDPGLGAGTGIKALHVQELRSAVVAIEGHSEPSSLFRGRCVRMMSLGNSQITQFEAASVVHRHPTSAIRGRLRVTMWGP